MRCRTHNTPDHTMSTPTTTTEHKAPGFSAIGAAHQPATPGPWHYDANDGRVESDAGTLLAVMQPGGDGGPILTPDEMHANGRLMAAAPTLLVSLRQALARLEHSGEDAAFEIANARFAIRAATGQPEDE